MDSKLYNDNVKIFTPELDLKDNLVSAIIKGCETITPKKYNITSISNSGFTISQNVPQRVLVDRRFRLVIDSEITFTGDSNDPNRNLLQTGQDALRSFPLHRSMENLSVSLNSQTFSTVPRKTNVALRQFYDNYNILNERSMSTSPGMLDNCQQYAQLNGTINNPLGGFYDTIQGAESGRGTFSYNEITNETDSAVVKVTLAEDLMIHPLIFGTENRFQAFGNLTNFVVDVTFSNKIADYFWSHSTASSSTITNISVKINSGRLELVQYTPSIEWAMQMPKYMAYPVDDVTFIAEAETSSVAPNESQTVISNTKDLSVIPRFVVIYLQKRENEYTFNDTDSFAKINSIQVTFGNKSALLSNASDFELYNMSRKNGLSVSYPDWSANDIYSELGNTSSRYNGRGSVIKLEVGSDLPLYENEAPGAYVQKQLQVEINFTNKHPTDSIKYDVFVLTITPGYCLISKDSCLYNRGMFNENDVLNSPLSDDLEYGDLDDQLMSGGLSFKKIAKKFRKRLKKLKPLAKKLAPLGQQLVSQYAPQYAPAYDLGQQMLLGDGQHCMPMDDQMGNGLVGGYDTSYLNGGMSLSKNQIRNQLKNYSLD